MDWMFKEHDRTEESSSDVKSQPSRFDSETSMDDQSSTVMNDHVRQVGPTEENMTNWESTLLENGEERHEEYSTVTDLITSPLDEITATDKDSEQTSVKADVYGSSNTLSLEKGGTNGDTSKNCGVPVGGPEKTNEEECNDTTSKDNEAIKILKEEV